jgi:hypothetical protein
MAADQSLMSSWPTRLAILRRAAPSLLQGCVAVFALWFIHPASAQSPIADASTHTWNDGQRQRRLTLQPDLQADFTPRLDKGGPIQPGTSTSASALSSPVLRDDNGQLRALPGGVLVILKAPHDAAQQRGLE